jgi:hypothetical protein
MSAEAAPGPADDGSAAADDAATLSVVRGEPTAEEIAALVAVLAGRVAAQEQAQARAQSEKPARMSGWTDRSRYVQGRLSHSADGWRRSALPR